MCALTQSTAVGMVGPTKTSQIRCVLEVRTDCPALWQNISSCLAAAREQRWTNAVAWAVAWASATSSSAAASVPWLRLCRESCRESVSSFSDPRCKPACGFSVVFSGGFEKIELPPTALPVVFLIAIQKVTVLQYVDNVDNVDNG